MVVKLGMYVILSGLEFESRVILDGSQTISMAFLPLLEFESRVILDGSQTSLRFHNELFRV